MRAQQQIENTIPGIAEYSRFETSVNKKDVAFGAAENIWKQDTAFCGRGLAEIMQTVNDQSACVLKIEELISTVSDSESKIDQS